MRTISSKPAPDRKETKRKAVCWIRGQFWPFWPQASVTSFSLSVSQSVSQSWQDAQIGNGLIALRPVFRAASVLPPIGPRGTLFVEHLAIINSVPFLPMDHTSEHLTDPDVLGQLV